MKHCMLDIETLGTTPGAVVLSIGAVVFKLSPLTMCGQFNMVISLEDSIRVGLAVEASTLKWWLTQRAEVLRDQLQKALPINFVLGSFNDWFRLEECSTIWGNSAAFDMGMLAAVYRAAGETVPWEFRSERCYRTVVKLCGDKLVWNKKDTEQAHNPVYDCMYQIEHLHKATKILGIEL